MHTFNTIEMEGFLYPKKCARCAKDEVGATWRVVHATIEFPEGMPSHPMEHKPRNYTDYVARVPICKGCHGALSGRKRLCRGIGGLVGSATALALLLRMIDAGTKVEGAMLYSAVTGVGVAIVVGWVLKLIAVGASSFARLNGLEQRIRFKNKDYQAAFDRLNAPTPQESDYARAW
jgi:hypothetical protein